MRPMEDEQIIDLFFARSEQAIVELDRKYGTLSTPFQTTS